MFFFQFAKVLDQCFYVNQHKEISPKMLIFHQLCFKILWKHVKRAYFVQGFDPKASSFIQQLFIAKKILTQYTDCSQDLKCLNISLLLHKKFEFFFSLGMGKGGADFLMCPRWIWVTVRPWPSVIFFPNAGCLNTSLLSH